MEKKEVFVKIKNLFEGDNYGILFALSKKGITKVYPEELHACGVIAEEFIKTSSIGSSDLLSRLVFWSETYYPGITLIFDSNSYFTIIPNDYTAEQVQFRMKLRQLYWELEGLENTIWAYRFDMEMRDIESADRLAPKVNLIKEEIEIIEKALKN